MAVLRHLPAETPVLVIVPLINQFVVRLRRADPVIVKFLEIIYLGHLRGFGGLIETAVVKALIVLRPRRAGEFHPLQIVAQILAGPHVAHLPFLPIRTGRGQSVGHEIAVVADGEAGQRHRAVGGKFVGIEQHDRFGVERRERVEHALVLQPVVPTEEVAAALLERRAVTLVIPELRQPRA